MEASQLRTQIEQKLPCAFAVYQRQQRGTIPTGIPAIDSVVAGIPLGALTEICGSNVNSSGKTSVLISLLAQTTRDRCCALVDASDSFDPHTGYAAGINFANLLWVRCGQSRARIRRLEQAFKVTDILLQSSGFALIAVNLSRVPERAVNKVPLSSWFRFSRVIEKQSAALVFIEQKPHAASCAGLVLQTSAEPVFSGNLFKQLELKVEIVRGREKKPASSEHLGFSLKTQWA